MGSRTAFKWTSWLLAFPLGLMVASGCGTGELRQQGLDDAESDAFVEDGSFTEEPGDSLALSCGERLAVASIQASGEDPPTPASFAVDGSLATRWSSKGVGQFITADLGKTKRVCQVGVAWYGGASGRVNHYVMAVSTDGNVFTQVLAGDSSGRTANVETYSLATPLNARYVRLTVNGNTSNTWASVTELSVAGASDITAVQTTLADSGPAQGSVQTSTAATFTFSASEAGAQFECRLNGSAWAGCSSPQSYTGLGLRVHTFEVRAGDRSGNVDATPAKRIFTVVSGTPGVVKPGPDNTGVPAGTVLKRHDGDIVVTVANTHLDALDIHGFVTIKAPNVKITRCILRGGYSNDAVASKGVAMILNYTPTASFTIEDSELIPEYPSIWLDGIRGMNFTARRVEIQNTTDGIGINGIGTSNQVNVRVESSWIHHMRYKTPTPPGYQKDNQTHNDGIQYHSGNNTRIIGNLITDAHNAAMMISQSLAGTWDLEVRNNWVDGGGCTINLSHSPDHFTSMPPAGKSPGLTFADNQFGHNASAANGQCAFKKSAGTHASFIGNIYEDTGAVVWVRP